MAWSRWWRLQSRRVEWYDRSIDRSCSWSLSEGESTCVSSKEEYFVLNDTAGMSPAGARLATISLNSFPGGFLHVVRYRMIILFRNKK